MVLNSRRRDGIKTRRRGQKRKNEDIECWKQGKSEGGKKDKKMSVKRAVGCCSGLSGAKSFVTSKNKKQGNEAEMNDRRGLIRSVPEFGDEDEEQ